MVVANSEEPTKYQEAISNPNSSKWSDAMDAKMRSLERNHVWELVELPTERKIISSKWVFKLKKDEDGNVERFKARLVPQGFSQQQGRALTMMRHSHR